MNKWEKVQAVIGTVLDVSIWLAFAAWIIFMTVQNPEWIAKAVGLAIILFLAALFTSDR